MAEWVMASAALAALATSTTQGVVSYNQQKHALEDQKRAQEKASAQQKAADESAEKQRLEALAANMEATDYGNVWGVDSNKFADTAQKLSAGTGDFNTDDDEDNPFYTRGLL